MKRSTLLLILLIISTHLVAVPLVLETRGTVPPSVVNEVRQALERSMLSRLSSEHELSALLECSEDTYHLNLEYKQRTLNISLPTDTESFLRYLKSALAYDGRSLMDLLEGFSLDFYTASGYGLSYTDDSLYENTVFHAISADGTYEGRVLVSDIFEDQKIALLTQDEGNRLGLGMTLVQKKAFPFSFGMSIEKEGVPSFDFTYAKYLKIHPFSIGIGVGTLGLDTAHLSLLLKADIPIATFFGTKSYISRNLSIGSGLQMALGYSFSHAMPYVAASGSLYLTYHIRSWAFSLGAGNKIALTKNATLAQGLFLSLTTAYTYSL